MYPMIPIEEVAESSGLRSEGSSSEVFSPLEPFNKNQGAKRPFNLRDYSHHVIPSGFSSSALSEDSSETSSEYSDSRMGMRLRDLLLKTLFRVWSLHANAQSQARRLKIQAQRSLRIALDWSRRETVGNVLRHWGRYIKTQKEAGAILARSLSGVQYTSKKAGFKALACPPRDSPPSKTSKRGEAIKRALSDNEAELFPKTPKVVAWGESGPPPHLTLNFPLQDCERKKARGNGKTSLSNALTLAVSTVAAGGGKRDSGKEGGGGGMMMGGFSGDSGVETSRMVEKEKCITCSARGEKAHCEAVGAEKNASFCYNCCIVFPQKAKKKEDPSASFLKEEWKGKLEKSFAAFEEAEKRLKIKMEGKAEKEGKEGELGGTRKVGEEGRGGDDTRVMKDLSEMFDKFDSVLSKSLSKSEAREEEGYDEMDVGDEAGGGGRAPSEAVGRLSERSSAITEERLLRTTPSSGSSPSPRSPQCVRAGNSGGKKEDGEEGMVFEMEGSSVAVVQEEAKTKRKSPEEVDEEKRVRFSSPAPHLHSLSTQDTRLLGHPSLVADFFREGGRGEMEGAGYEEKRRLSGFLVRRGSGRLCGGGKRRSRNSKKKLSTFLKNFKSSAKEEQEEDEGTDDLKKTLIKRIQDLEGEIVRLQEEPASPLNHQGSQLAPSGHLTAPRGEKPRPSLGQYSYRSSASRNSYGSMEVPPPPIPPLLHLEVLHEEAFAREEVGRSSYLISPHYSHMESGRPEYEREREYFHAHHPYPPYPHHPSARSEGRGGPEGGIYSQRSSHVLPDDSMSQMGSRYAAHHHLYRPQGFPPPSLYPPHLSLDEEAIRRGRWWEPGKGGKGGHGGHGGHGGYGSHLMHDSHRTQSVGVDIYSPEANFRGGVDNSLLLDPDSGAGPSGWSIPSHPALLRRGGGPKSPLAPSAEYLPEESNVSL